MTDHRDLLRRMAAHYDHQCQNPAEDHDDRIRWAERAAAIGWALKAEIGQVTATPDHHQALIDWEGDLTTAMTGPNIVHNAHRLAEVTRRADAVRWAAKLLEPAATVKVGAA